MMPLANKTALVTGAAQGLGRAIALRLAREGAAVGINYLSNSAGAESLAAEIAAGQGRSVIVRADVGDAAQVRAMVDQVSSEFGPVDILINNAGLHRPGDLFDFEYSQWRPCGGRMSMGCST